MLKLPALPLRSSQLIQALQDTRSFPRGYWHASDVESAAEVMGAQLETFGIAMPLPIAALKAQLAAADIVNDDEEAAARRVSIALVASAANEALRAAGESARLYQFREDLADWESDEPVWMLLLPEERNQLVADGALRPLDGGTTDALL